MTDIINRYNPANVEALTAAEIEAMQYLSNEEIKALARAYPNEAFHSAYLLIIDNRIPSNKQVPSLSSWPNLHNLRALHGLTNWVALNFKKKYVPIQITPSVWPPKEPEKVVDLSESELMNLPGFKTSTIPDSEGELNEAKDVKLKRIKKQKPQ